MNGGPFAYRIQGCRVFRQFLLGLAARLHVLGRIDAHSFSCPAFFYYLDFAFRDLYCIKASGLCGARVVQATRCFYDIPNFGGHGRFQTRSMRSFQTAVIFRIGSGRGGKMDTFFRMYCSSSPGATRVSPGPRSLLRANKKSADSNHAVVNTIEHARTIRAEYRQ
jgi:hypothetical protein